jgi:hypothetical protein
MNPTSCAPTRMVTVSKLAPSTRASARNPRADVDGLEAEGLAVQLLGPGQIRNRYTDALDSDHCRRRGERQREERNQNGRERRADVP